MNRPIYRANPIASVNSLALALRVNEGVLRNYATQRDDLYDHFSVEKSDGSPRLIRSPKKELKFIQKRINRVVFENVTFPEFLFGGIKERDYVQNASEHSGARALIALDIRNFYPSITELQVKNIFKFFCKFPDDVANLLMRLTTLDGSVPQGACTSSNIANLAFFDIENLLVDQLHSQGFKYTRLLDDISISSLTRQFGRTEQAKIIERVASMLKMRGMHLKNQKTKVVTKENPEHLMEITGLWVNRGKPRVKREERIDIRREVRKVQQLFKLSRISAEYHKTFNRTSGRVAKLAHLQHVEAFGARTRLREMLPHLSIEDQVHLARQVSSLSAAKSSKRATWEYLTKYYKVAYTVNILKRSNKKAARRLDSLLAKCRPTRSHESIIYG